MMEHLNSIPEEQANLHIVENMDVNNLPELMKSVLSLAQTPAEKDMLLMSALVACGSVMPNLYVRYGPTAVLSRVLSFRTATLPDSMRLVI